ncbi:gamma-glutamylcyclotransferase family protein [Ralstonia insidiosa]|uniref:Gamma-glutamylcyclotransferase family protein n=1 Tax=Ralstonia insidiosa TaxID=190721 RepID=A0A848P4T7_9RALS|nr:gamma-glutamylcyclotransferase family protein [Ralstonia insidiosa]NMV40559.1 gamma-glutamylcyclotransferase [Ralstonia insidiosa]
MSDHVLVFVFGTLKEGFPNFQTNRGRRIPGEYRTVERFPLYLVGERMSPWMIDLAGEGEHVEGQLFSVDAETLAAMDRLERIHEADGYRRIEISVTLTTGSNGLETAAFAYVKPEGSLANADVRKGPMPRYALADAALYRPRSG